MTINLTCKKCNKQNKVSSIKEKVVNVDNGAYLKASYFVCDCGSKNIVQYDNKATEQMSRVVRNILIDSIKKKANGQTPSIKQKRKADKINKQLDKMRKELEAKYNEKVVLI